MLFAEWRADGSWGSGRPGGKETSEKHGGLSEGRNSGRRQV